MFREDIVKIIIDVIVSSFWKQRNNDSGKGNVSLAVTRRSATD